MEITGRVTKNAEIRTTESGKKVVGFDLAINENYKTKGGEKKQRTTFFECSFWRNEGIAMYLTKGSLVALSGMVGINPYLSKGEAKASLTFRADQITLLGKGNSNTEPAKQQSAQITENAPVNNTLKPSESFDAIPVPEDDLPF